MQMSCDVYWNDVIGVEILSGIKPDMLRSWMSLGNDCSGTGKRVFILKPEEAIYQIDSVSR